MSGGGGYTATTDALSKASKNIGDLAEKLLDDNPDLQNSQVTKEKFGRVHEAHADKYLAGAKALGEALSGYSKTLEAFGTNISSAGSKYGANEDNQVGNIDNAGTL
ncbi:hypothetical protein [Amycolatopsis benzoatilytica]|uniref:hypothetical protein n=1 Tax=Amycolatopsis benzoatilytica TaxID=346045 RepID=UPI00037B533E|nr:hypothetical protein [Amycolatopsis benzoatilytica]